MRKGPTIVFILFIFWFFTSSWFYVFHIKDAYPDRYALAEDNYPIFFKINSFDAMKGNNFNTYKSDLLLSINSTHKLLITGVYSPNEVNSSRFDNLGLARAYRFSQMFPEIDSNFLVFNSAVLDSISEIKFKKSLWSSMVNTRVLTQNQTVQETKYGADIFHNGPYFNTQLEAYLQFLSFEYSLSDIQIQEVSNESIDTSFNKSIQIRDKLLSLNIDSNHLLILPYVLDSTQSSHIKIFIHDTKSNTN
jgi:hypothetical protein